MDDVRSSVGERNAGDDVAAADEACEAAGDHGRMISARGVAMRCRLTITRAAACASARATLRRAAAACMAAGVGSEGDEATA